MTINNIVVRQLVVDKISELEDQVRSLRRWLDGPVAAAETRTRKVRKTTKKALKHLKRKSQKLNKKIKRAKWSVAQREKFMATTRRKYQAAAALAMDAANNHETIDESIDREGI